MKIHAYNRDTGGLVEYRDAGGGWDSIADFLTEHGQAHRINDAPKPEPLTGWPDERVYWFGPVGIGSRTYER